MIGFHAAHDARSGDVSGIANALVGAYLNKIGLPTQAVIYITAAAPNSILWLSLEDARLYGIDVGLLATPTIAPETPVAGTGTESRTPLEAEAVGFVVRHAATESASGQIAIERVRTHYADVVRYYGKHLDRTAVMKEYETFVERWPERQYAVRPHTVEVQCFPGSHVCNVTAAIDWVAISRPRGKKSVGQSTWSVALIRSNGSFLITSVNGTVLKRQITDIPDDPVAIQPGFADRAFGQR